MAEGRWGDLGPRIASAIVMVAIALAALWAGGWVWAALAAAVLVLTFRELVPLCDPGATPTAPWALGLLMLAPMVPVAMGTAHGAAFYGPLALVFILGLIAVHGAAGRLIWLGYGLMLFAGAAGLLAAGMEAGPARFAVLGLVAVVATSDTLGYFVGRILGGPKFWPRVSPKKTWSGTVAGWVGGALVGAGLGYWQAPGAPDSVTLAAVFGAVLAFAGQIGDIAESAMKRRVRVKDASNLIPGHGGVLDRLDALIAAAALVTLVALVGRGVLAP